jgi:hypothetical protein
VHTTSQNAGVNVNSEALKFRLSRMVTERVADCAIVAHDNILQRFDQTPLNVAYVCCVCLYVKEGGARIA